MTTPISRRGFMILVPAGVLLATEEDHETEDNQEGPYYKPGAPVRTNLVEPGIHGTRLVLSGQVLGTDGKPIPHAEIDLWQADDKGDYDNSGFKLRGKLYTMADGNYRVETIVPRHYSAGTTVRPPHLHVKVHAGSGPVLTTQLYFRGNQYNYADASVRPSLLLDLKQTGDGRAARFDFVVRRG